MAVFTLAPVPPFRLDLTVWVLRRLPITRRVLMLGDKPVEVAVVQAGSAREPKYTVTTRGARLGITTREALVSMLDKMLGILSSVVWHSSAVGAEMLGEMSQ